MKIKYVKFSDERRKEFCIKTVIGQEKNKKIVYKEAIFEEGIEHIKKMTENADKLRQCYEAEVCGVEYIEGKAFFEYVQGESLEKRYQKAMNKGDTAEIEKLLKFHKSIIMGKKENQVIFTGKDAENIRLFLEIAVYLKVKEHVNWQVMMQ